MTPHTPARFANGGAPASCQCPLCTDAPTVCQSCGGTGEAYSLEWMGYNCRTCEGSGRVIVIDGLPCAVQPNGTYRDAKGKFRPLFAQPAGMYYTPATIFDPAAGSGGLLAAISNPPYAAQPAQVQP